MGLDPPTDIGEPAAAVWREVVARHFAAGDLSTVQVELLRAWCRTVVEIREAEQWCAANGTTYVLRDDKGQVRATGEAPAYRQLRALRKDLTTLARAMEAMTEARGRLARRAALGANLIAPDG